MSSINLGNILQSSRDLNKAAGEFFSHTCSWERPDSDPSLSQPSRALASELNAQWTRLETEIRGGSVPSATTVNPELINVFNAEDGDGTVNKSLKNIAHTLFTLYNCSKELITKKQQEISTVGKDFIRENILPLMNKVLGFIDSFILAAGINDNLAALLSELGMSFSLNDSEQLRTISNIEAKFKELAQSYSTDVDDAVAAALDAPRTAVAAATPTAAAEEEAGLVVANAS